MSNSSTDDIILFCIPYAGGSSHSFQSWLKRMASRINVVPLELPGHGRRTRENLLLNVDEIVDDLLGQLLSKLNGGKYAIFGHSFGALLCYELYFKIRETTENLPLHVFFSAAPPPHHIKSEGNHLLSEQELSNKIARIQSIKFNSPAESMQIDKFFLNIYRADITALESNRWVMKGKLDCPTTIFFSSNDCLVNMDLVSEWEMYTESKPIFNCCGDVGHMYLDSLQRFIEKTL